MSDKEKELIQRLKMLLAKATDTVQVESSKAARMEFTQALELPLRQGVMDGNNIDGIFERAELDHGTVLEYPLDFVMPGTEKDYRAFTIPLQGHMPELHVNGDYVTIPTYEIGATIDMRMKYARDAGWFVVNRALSVLESMMTKKRNDDGWHVLLIAGADRNILVTDSVANTGQFTKRLVSLCKTVMRRNGGGNSTSIMRGRLTDLFLSPELVEGMRDWGIDQVDEVTRREIYTASDDSDKLNRVFGINLHDMDELGEDQEYQNYFLNEIGTSINANDTELLVGLDLFNNDSFIMPVKTDVKLLEREDLLDQRRIGWMSLAELGFASLDNRRVLIASA